MGARSHRIGSCHQFLIKIVRWVFSIVTENLFRVIVIVVAEVGAGEKPDSILTLRDWCALVQSGEQVIRISNGSDVLCLAHRKGSAFLCLAPGWQGLLVLRQGCKCSVAVPGCCRCRKRIFSNCSCSSTRGVPEVRPAPGEPWAALSEGQANGERRRHWSPGISPLRCKMTLPIGLLPVICAAVSIISCLVLLEQSYGGEKLQDLAGRYGVSVSHFRRLCRQALGGAAKSELRGGVRHERFEYG